MTPPTRHWRPRSYCRGITIPGGNDLRGAAAAGSRGAGKDPGNRYGKRFTVGIYRDGLFFTPASSGYGQADGRKPVERFLQRYNETASLRPGGYAPITRNASYLIGLLLWARARAGVE